MRQLPVPLLTLVAMLAFAGNSLLCRLALRDTAIDAGSFTGIRIAAGAMVLWLFVRFRTKILAWLPPVVYGYFSIYVVTQ